MTIERPPTKVEQDLTSIDSEGDSTGFITLGKFASKREEDRKGIETEGIIIQRNRYILTHSKKPLDEIKNLSCHSCFRSEFNKDLVDADLKTNFEKYKGRLEFIKIFPKKTQSRNNPEHTEKAIQLRVRCRFCDHKIGFSINEIELEKEVFKELWTIGQKSEGINWEAIGFDDRRTQDSKEERPDIHKTKK